MRHLPYIREKKLTINTITSFITGNINICFIAAFMIVLLAELHKRKLLIVYLLICFLYMLVLLYLFSHGQADRESKLVYCLEYMHLLPILFLIWRNRAGIKAFIGHIDVTETRLIAITVAINLVAVGYLFLSNSRYIYPHNVTGIIGNYYYNADPGRGITYALTNIVQANNHPLYRFVLNIFVIPCIMLFNVLGHQSWFLGGYWLVFLQVGFNGISAFMLYRLIKDRAGSMACSVCLVLLYALSAACIWTAILPETYSLAACLLLVTLYLFQRDAPVAGAAAVLSIGINPILGVAYIPYLYRRVKPILIRYLWIWMPLVIAGAYLGRDLFHGYVLMIEQYRETGFSLAKQMQRLWVSLFASGFLGPHTVYVGPYFFQRLAYSHSDIILLVVIVVAVLPLAVRKKDRRTYAAIALLAAGVVLHGAIGFGLDYGFIYSALYVPVLILLLADGVRAHKRRWLGNGIVALLVIMTCLHSGKWLYTLGRDVGKVAFPITEWEHPAPEMQVGKVKFVYDDHTLSAQGKGVLAGIDSIQVSKSEGKIVGTLYDGTIFSVEVSGDRYGVQILQ